jgi:AraC-like DNA-binding protein/mannose-6-phosphate isomerase-like protein (cupin superfamily)
MDNIANDDLTSHWPLPAQGVRQITPVAMREQLHKHPLTCDLVPLAQGFYPSARGHQMQRKEHHTYLLLYCTAGSGSLVMDGTRASVSAGDAIVLPPGLTHGYRAARQDPWSVYWAHFDGPKSDDFLNFTGLTAGINSVGVYSSIISNFDDFLATRRQGFGSDHFIQLANQLRVLLTSFALAGKNTLSRQPPNLDTLGIVEYMRRHINHNLTLAQLSELAGQSKYHFSREFKHSTGHSPIQHFIFMKMERACELLDTTSMPIKVIASELGFTDPLYFSRQFSRVMGMPPARYRNSHRA